MKVELPELKRCCCCLPLRRGLLACGYIKLITLLLLDACLFIMVWFLNAFNERENEKYVIIGITLLLLSLINMAFTIVFLVGGHQKSPRLLKIFYIYSIVILCISVLVSVMTTALTIISESDEYDNNPHGFVESAFSIYGSILSEVVNIALEAYFILLLRSEINKLRNDSSFSFNNHAAEAQCTMVDSSLVQEEVTY